MSLSLSITDNADGTGATATIAGADSATTATVYVSLVNQGNNPLAWVSAGSRSGNGTVSLPVLPSYYFAYCAGTVSAAAALTPPIIFLASYASESVQQQVEMAILAKIQTLTLTGLATPPGNLPSSRIMRFDTPMTDDLIPLVGTLPAIIVAPAGEAAETVKPVVNARDDIGWPVNVIILANFAPRQQGYADSIKRWREQIFRAVRFQRLPTVAEVYTVIPEPKAILTWKPPLYDYVFSALTFRAMGRDYRGV